MPPFLSLVIPAYNEAGRLPRNLPRVAAYCQTLALPAPGGWEVLVMVERSTDGTLEKTRAAAAAFPSVQVIDNGPQRGKGHAVRAGMLRAAGRIVLFMDADLSTPLPEIARFLAWLAAHPETEVLIGNRRHPESRIGRPQGWLRRRLSGAFNRLVKDRVLGESWTDTQCGFKAFRARAAREIFSRQQLDGFSFDVEVLALAAALRLPVADLPVEWHDDRATRLHLWRDGRIMWHDVRRVPTLVDRALRDQPPGRPESSFHAHS